jgi:hypothetical protein
MAVQSRSARSPFDMVTAPEGLRFAVLVERPFSPFAVDDLHNIGAIDR